MTLLELLILLLIAGLTGSVARTLVGFDRGGCLISIVVGFIGAFIGTWLARELNLPDILSFEIRDINYPIIWSTIGAVLFTGVLALLTPRRTR